MNTHKEICSFYYKEKCCGVFLVVAQTLFGNIILRILINFIFDFQVILFAKIAQSHLHYLSTSLVLKLLYVLSTSFLAYSSFIKVVQLFKSFPMIYSTVIFRRKKISALWGLGFKIRHFRFSVVAEAVCTPTIAPCVCFLTSQYPMTEIKYSPVVQL